MCSFVFNLRAWIADNLHGMLSLNAHAMEQRQIVFLNCVCQNINNRMQKSKKLNLLQLLSGFSF